MRSDGGARVHFGCGMRELLTDPELTVVLTQHALLDLPQGSCHMRLSSAVMAQLDAYCKPRALQKRGLVEALLRAFLAEQAPESSSNLPTPARLHCAPCQTTRPGVPGV